MGFRGIPRLRGPASFVTILTLAASLFIGQSVPAQNDGALIGPFRTLRKITRKIHGNDPSAAQYQTLRDFLKKKPTENESTEFFRLFAREQMKHPGHAEKMNFRLSALHYVPTSYVALKEENGEFVVADEALYLNQSQSIHSLFRNLIRNNFSWDYLLTADSYEVGQGEANFFPLDLAVGISEDEFDPSGQVKRRNARLQPNLEYLRFPNHQNIAGVLSTKSWRERYTATEINKNRRNAAAVFRIYMCDPMFPEIETNAELDQSVIVEMAKIFQAGMGGVAAEPVEVEKDNVDRHGDDPACAGCHIKLDPAGEVFGPANKNTLPLQVVAAQWDWEYPQEEVMNYGFEGLRGLAETVIRTKRYSECQVTHFWDWFISRERIRRPSRKRMDELVAKFNELGRKPNDFIEYLIATPEFRADEIAPQPARGNKPVGPSYDQIKPILDRCNTCHRNDGSVFTNVVKPNGGTFGDYQRFTLMLDRLELPIENPESMPRARAKWNQDDIKAVKSWLIVELDQLEEKGVGAKP